MAWSTTHEARVNQSWEANPRNVPTAGKYTFEIPDCFSGQRIMFIQKPASILLVEHAGETPWLTCERLDVEDLDDEDIPGMGALNLNWTREIMNTTKSIQSSGG